MPTSVVTAKAETSFIAYLHYLEDLANVIKGRYGQGADGVYLTLRLHPPVRELPGRTLTGQETKRLFDHLSLSWDKLAAIGNAVAVGAFDRQANAVVPGLTVDSVESAASALALCVGADPPIDTREALELLGDVADDGLFPYPWSATCIGCPQLGTTQWGGSVLPGEALSVFAAPEAQTSDARLALLLRTTRQRIIERRFAVERQTDVKPGRSRRNLSLEHKEAVAASVPPTTGFDVLDRVRRRCEGDDGEAFVAGPIDNAEALRFAQALATVAESSVAAIHAIVATVIGWDLFTDLLDGHRRRSTHPPPWSPRSAFN